MSDFTLRICHRRSFDGYFYFELVDGPYCKENVLMTSPQFNNPKDSGLAAARVKKALASVLCVYEENVNDN